MQFFTDLESYEKTNPAKLNLIAITKSTMLFDLEDNGTVEIQDSRIALIKKKEIATGTA
jgi:hypothetical protein